MTQHKPWDRIKVTRIFLLLLLDILLINLSSFLALFTRMELDLTALLESGFLDSIYRYALMDTVCTILIFWFFRLYNSLWAYAGTNELTRIAAASIVAAAVKYVGMHLLALPTPKSFPWPSWAAAAWLTAISGTSCTAAGRAELKSAPC